MLVFGESTAAGVGVESHDHGMAGALARTLNTAWSRPVRWSVVGQGGATAAAARDFLLPHVEPNPYDAVVVMLGVNDTLALTSVAKWRRGIGTILDRLMPLLAPGGSVVLAGVPRIDTFPSLPQPLRRILGNHARALDRALEQVASTLHNVQYVPTPPVEQADHLASDRFHLGEAGYADWAGVVAEQIIRSSA